MRNISDKPSQHEEEDGDEVDGDSYYVFSVSDGQSHTLTVMIESGPVSVIIDSGATCNLMSGNVFYKVSKGKTELSKTDRKIHAYASQQPLKLSGKCLLKVFVPDTQMLTLYWTSVHQKSWAY